MSLEKSVTEGINEDAMVIEGTNEQGEVIVRDFNDLLSGDLSDKRWEYIPAPEGTYTWIIEDYTLGTSARKVTPYVGIVARALEYNDENFPEEMEANEIEKEIKFYFSMKGAEPKNFRLGTFIKTILGVEEGDRKKLLEELKGKTFRALLEEKLSDDGKTKYSEINDNTIEAA